MAIHLSAGAEPKVETRADRGPRGYYKWLRIGGHTEGNVEPRPVQCGKGRVYGLELAVRLEMRERSARCRTRCRACERQQRDGSYGCSTTTSRIFSRPRRAISGRGWWLVVDFRLVSGNTRDADRRSVYLADDDSYFRSRPHTTAGAPRCFTAWTCGREALEDPSRSITLYLEVQNVLNQRHPEARCRARLSPDGGSAGLPILPIIGVRGEL